MRSRRLFALMLAALGTTTLVGAQSSNVRIVLGPIAKAPAAARSWKNPYDQQPDAVRAGEKLFKQHCAECHGDDARGRGRAADLLSPPVQNATSGELVWFLRNGNLAAGMPSWSGLPVERRWQIVAYVKSQSETTTPKKEQK